MEPCGTPALMENQCELPPGICSLCFCLEGNWITTEKEIGQYLPV